MGVKQTYSLCPNTGDARERLYEQVRSFADQQKAQLYDRGAGVKREFSSMDSELLTETGSDPVLLTVEKPEELLLSVSNLGLKEKFVLAVTSWGETGEDSAVTRFIAELQRFWTIQEVDGGVTNDPPC